MDVEFVVGFGVDQFVGDDFCVDCLLVVGDVVYGVEVDFVDCVCFSGKFGDFEFFFCWVGVGVIGGYLQFVFEGFVLCDWCCQ